ncbi:MAG: alanine--tRNA ligase [Proteobacteria bacterium]|nr:alanine--tRNA ligase [Pseudomonadota bacterium]
MTSGPSAQNTSRNFLTAQEIKQAFLDFYRRKGHTVVRSFPVVSHSDPSTLFVNSGMMPLKSVFLGHNPKGYKRVCNVQKVLRVAGKHNDLDEVGVDDYHHTFFEMLGHWSFGDYFKKETIVWGWQLMTEVYQLSKSRLFVTVHHEDQEAKDIWLNETDVIAKHVLSFDQENVWTMGGSGPCGYCSEIHYDRFPQSPVSSEDSYLSPTEGVNSTGSRYIELINFVFIDREKTSQGEDKPLPAKHIDTGAGFERICMVVQDVSSPYKTDLFWPIIEKIVEISGVTYTEETGAPHRIIADHLRAVVFALSDGVNFARDGRGYVIRRILRRAERYVHALGLRQPLLHRLVGTLSQVMASSYPEIQERQAYIEKAIFDEESQFLTTLDHGLRLLDKEMNRLKQTSETTLPGKTAFTLYDTYGFPYDLTSNILAEHGLLCDQGGYDEAMKAQRTRGQKSQKFHTADSGASWQTLLNEDDSRFCGYDTLMATVKTVRYRQVDHTASRVYEFVFDQTPFYPTSGGQLGDQGIIENHGVCFMVDATYKHLDSIIHRATLTSQNSESLNDKSFIQFQAKVNEKNRKETAKHHSGTHLLHSALRNQLGDHVTQMGSYCDGSGLRFDFSHPSALTATEIRNIEIMVNTWIQEAYPVDVSYQSLEAAKDSGALFMAGDKYDDQVRVLTIGNQPPTGCSPWLSKELCGGTHVVSTGECGVFVIISENSIAQGIRRIQAKAGEAARDWLLAQRDELQHIHHFLQKPYQEPSTYGIIQKLQNLIQTSNQLKQVAMKYDSMQRAQFITSLLSTARQVGNIRVIYEDISGLEAVKDAMPFMTALSEQIKDKSMVVVLFKQVAQPQEDSSATDLVFLCVVSKNLQPQWHAGKLVKFFCGLWQGRGGGRPEYAQGGAKAHLVNDKHGLREQIKQVLAGHLLDGKPPYSDEDNLKKNQGHK